MLSSSMEGNVNNSEDLKFQKGVWDPLHVSYLIRLLIKILPCCHRHHYAKLFKYPRFIGIACSNFIKDGTDGGSPPIIIGL